MTLIYKSEVFLEPQMSLHSVVLTTTQETQRSSAAALHKRQVGQQVRDCNGTSGQLRAAGETASGAQPAAAAAV